MDNLKKYRDEIDEIDKQITELFERRMDISREISRCKKEQEIGILNARREEEVIQKNLSYLKNKDYRFVLEGFFRNLMNLSKLIQNEENHR
ncbi:chorismate mutase [Terrisporobacter petrolearius]|uniref:chorismate mutase n=1 Tax=Terrisporobacter petrolearius TaxID=1460447 RepID=UPI001D16118B|nr:chorismate mutase [Terrisporobacter petrolearius]MCC3865646.1 chorismate mutase [Terrisporobacter petrolearius]